LSRNGLNTDIGSKTTMTLDQRWVEMLYLIHIRYDWLQCLLLKNKSSVEVLSR
jgi:hypothetical protein